MAMFHRFAATLLGWAAIVWAPLPAAGQTTLVSAPVMMAPNWQPVAGAPRVTVANKGQGPRTVAGYSTSGPSPYYTDSPAYRSGNFTTFLPQAPASVTPAYPQPVVTTARPTIVPDQMITPMVQTPNGLIPGTVAAQPPIGGTGVPTYAPVIPSAPLVSTPPVTPAPVVQTPTPPVAPEATNPLPASTQPLVDNNVFIPTGQSWLDIPIDAYVSRFPPGTGAERSVREWILRKFGPDTWSGNQVSSLVVSPESVRVYHTTAVQEQVRGFLGRFVNYLPGDFQTQIRVLSVKDIHWRTKYAASLSPAGQNGSNPSISLVPGETAREMINSLGSGTAGTMLANPDQVAINGQHVVIDWSPREGRRSDPGQSGKPTEDSILLTMSPLIADDAARVEIDVSAAIRRAVTQRASMFGTRPNDVGPIERQVKDLVMVSPGEVMLIDLGEIPSFDDSKGLLGRDKITSILVFVSCAPSSNNQIQGRRVEVAQATGLEHRVAARPFTNETATPLATTPSSAKPASSGFSIPKLALPTSSLGASKKKKVTGPIVPPTLTQSVD